MSRSLSSGPLRAVQWSDPTGTALVRPDGRKMRVGRSSNIATRLNFSNVQTAQSQYVTYNGWAGETTMSCFLLAEAECHFDAVSLIVVNVTASPMSVAAALAAAPTQVASVGSHLGNTGALLFSGLGTATIQAGSLAAPSIVVSDPLPLSSQDRTDSGTRPLVMFDLQYSGLASGGTTSISYFNATGSDWGTSLAAGNINGRVMGYAAAKGTVGLASVPPWQYALNCCIFGYVYWTRGVAVKTVLSIGDSITGGSQLSTGKCMPFALKATQQVSTPSAPIEAMIFGMAGQAPSVYAPFARAFMSGFTSGATSGALVPTHLLYSAGSPNGAPTVTQAVVNSMNQQLMFTLATAGLMNIPAATWTMLPKNASATTPYWTGSSVTNRDAFNTALSTYNAENLDFASLVQYATDSSMYQTVSLTDPATGLPYINDMTTDNIHPSDYADKLFTSAKVVPWISGW